MSDGCDGCEALLDGCDGDHEGLKAALGSGYSVVWGGGYSEGYGHHGFDTLYRAADGRLIHAECGGCSCDGSGSWSFVADEAEAIKLVPEWQRDKIKGLNAAGA